ncbi:YALIA101S02e19306g1_1 [Yarrowia lipolytica]|nr:hypothetical protein YALI1_F07376g [Yarrowia lipolytica]SEI32512.1 YALIA101S02e19306g1_1 [Yarrowia lipolytica]VBB83321.1 Conserved hypothetical protein [Yarrowia lipolytica]
MPKPYCDYCDTRITPDTLAVRKAHCTGRSHIAHVVDYYERAAQELGLFPRDMPSTLSQTQFRRYNEKLGDAPSPNKDVLPLKTGTKPAVPGFDPVLNQSAQLNSILYSGAPGYQPPAPVGAPMVSKKGKKVLPVPPHCGNLPPPPGLFYS